MSTALLLAADSSDSSDDGSYVANEESDSDDEIEEPAAPERAPTVCSGCRSRVITHTYAHVLILYQWGPTPTPPTSHRSLAHAMRVRHASR